MGQKQTDLERFTAAYIECALWSSNDESDEQGGGPMDRNYSAEDIAPESLARMQADCAKFVAENSAALDRCDESGELPLRNDRARERGIADAYAMAGYDFWLTRNGHGAGFWDGDWPEPESKTLTDAAHAFGECDLYVGDDGRVWS